MSLGFFIFSLIPFIPFTEGHAFTPEVLRWVVLIGTFLLMPSLFYCLAKVPDCAPGVNNNECKSLQFKELMADRPVQIFYRVGRILHCIRCIYWHVVYFCR